jgi:hypothetical protein
MLLFMLLPFAQSNSKYALWSLLASHSFTTRNKKKKRQALPFQLIEKQTWIIFALSLSHAQKSSDSIN